MHVCVCVCVCGAAVWEVVSREAAFAGLSAAQVLFLVVVEGYRLPMPDCCPAPYAEIMRGCWQQDAESRQGSPLLYGI
jgi:Protein tyrosine and serine/threonine kinase